MIGKTISHYEVVAKLGGGGMGVVYKARDTRLDRPVALKFLPRHLGHDELSKKRFIHEAKTASSLDHPNICTIYDIQETSEGHLYIVMACYEGESLRQRISRGQMPMDDSIDICIQIAQGLAKAHSKGIIHRDIKPENIFLVEDNLVKILDFGLAKLTGSTQITRDGAIMGTLAYMSPEQTLGTEIDHRSDIWSVGVVLYELLTGDRPFSGESEHVIVHSIRHDEPSFTYPSGQDLPIASRELLKKALQKDYTARHPDMIALLRDLRSLPRQGDSQSLATISSFRNDAVPSIGVLPFTNMSADPEQEYFCDGMAEEIINSLAKLEGLRVAARTSTFVFKGRQEDIREIGRKLLVDMVLEGSVRKAGDRLRITAQLINVSDGFHVWSERYDRTLEDVFAIQDDISEAIITALKVQLIVGEEVRKEKRPTDNMEAYDLYLKGIHLFNHRTETENDKAMIVLERATKLDPSFAAAYARLAYAYIEKIFTYSPNPELEKRALGALERALTLDPQLAEAYVARGNLLWTKSNGFPHRAAIVEYERAIEVQPNLAEAHNDLGRTLWHIGALNRAHSSLKRALDIDPTHVDAQFRMGWLEMHRGNYERSLAFLRMLPKDSLIAYKDSLISLCLLYLRRSDEARTVIRRATEEMPSNSQIAGVEAIFCALEGKTDEAEAKIEEAIRLGEHLGHFHHNTHNIAAAYSLMNDMPKAMKWLEVTVQDGFPCYAWLEQDPCLENMWKLPQFSELMENLRKEWGSFEN